VAGDWYLHKPFNARALAARVRQALDSAL
jgi:DNA-binding response OmpR family regulator